MDEFSFPDSPMDPVMLRLLDLMGGERVFHPEPPEPLLPLPSFRTMRIMGRFAAPSPSPTWCDLCTKTATNRK